MKHDPGRIQVAMICHAVETLASLGSSDDIREFLAEKGITGSMCDGQYCPVRNYLTQETGVEELMVDGDVVFWGKDHHVDLPMSIRQFISGFDMGKYPELLD